MIKLRRWCGWLCTGILLGVLTASILVVSGCENKDAKSSAGGTGSGKTAGSVARVETPDPASSNLDFPSKAPRLNLGEYTCVVAMTSQDEVRLYIVAADAADITNRALAFIRFSDRITSTTLRPDPSRDYLVASVSPAVTVPSPFKVELVINGKSSNVEGGTFTEYSVMRSRQEDCGGFSFYVSEVQASLSLFEDGTVVLSMEDDNLTSVRTGISAVVETLDNDPQSIELRSVNAGRELAGKLERAVKTPLPVLLRIYRQGNPDEQFRGTILTYCDKERPSAALADSSAVAPKITTAGVKLMIEGEPAVFAILGENLEGAAFYLRTGETERQLPIEQTSSTAAVVRDNGFQSWFTPGEHELTVRSQEGTTVFPFKIEE